MRYTVNGEVFVSSENFGGNIRDVGSTGEYFTKEEVWS